MPPKSRHSFSWELYLLKCNISPKWLYLFKCFYNSPHCEPYHLAPWGTVAFPSWVLISKWCFGEMANFSSFASMMTYLIQLLPLQPAIVWPTFVHPLKASAFRALTHSFCDGVFFSPRLRAVPLEDVNYHPSIVTAQ